MLTVTQTDSDVWTVTCSDCGVVLLFRGDQARHRANRYSAIHRMAHTDFRTQQSSLTA